MFAGNLVRSRAEVPELPDLIGSDNRRAWKNLTV